MNMNKHTKGPWKFQRPLKVGGFKADGFQIFDDIHALIAEIPSGTDPEEEQANAQLIAAAPEMLDALKRTMKFLPSEIGADGYSDRIMLEKIIAKAESK